MTQYPCERCGKRGTTQSDMFREARLPLPDYNELMGKRKTYPQMISWIEPYYFFKDERIFERHTGYAGKFYTYCTHCKEILAVHR